jgi:hypothetical protein
VPEALRDAVGKREEKLGLQTRDPVEAEQRPLLPAFSFVRLCDAALDARLLLGSERMRAGRFSTSAYDPSATSLDFAYRRVM